MRSRQPRRRSDDSTDSIDLPSGQVVYAESPLDAYLREVAPEELEDVAAPPVQQQIAMSFNPRASTRRSSASSGSDREERQASRRSGGRRRSSGARQRVKASSEASNASSDGPASSSAMRATSDTSANAVQAEVLQIQEQLNRLLVSYLSSSNATPYSLPSASHTEDPSLIAKDARFGASQLHSSLSTNAGSDVTLNRRSQFILISLFGLLVAYPQIDRYLPQLPAALTLGAHASLLASIWKATPPVLVATGLATIWAGHPAQSASLNKVASPTRPQDIRHEHLLRQMLGLSQSMQELVKGLSSYDEQVSQVLRILEVLDATSANDNHFTEEDEDELDSSQPATSVRKALLSALTNAEIAAKVALDAVRQSSRSEGDSLVDREELERLIGMYALPAAHLAMSRPVSPADMTARRQSMSPNEYFSGQHSRRTSLLRQSHPPSGVRSPDWPSSAQKRQSFRHTSAWARSSSVTSPILDLHADHGPNTPLPVRSLAHDARRNRPASWAAGASNSMTPTKASIALMPTSGSNLSISSVLAGATAATRSDEAAHSPQTGRPAIGSSTPKRQMLNRRQSEQPGSISIGRTDRTSLLQTERQDSPLSTSMRMSRSAGAAPLPQQEPLVINGHTEGDSVPNDASIASERAKALERIQTLRPTFNHGGGQSRPSSMYELDFARLASTSSPSARRSSLSPADLAHRNILADHRRWSSHSQLLHDAGPSQIGRKSRPTSLLLERSPDLGSPPSFDSGLPTSRSLAQSARTSSHLSIQSLTSKKEEEMRLRRELLCLLLAVQYPQLPLERNAKSQEGLQLFLHRYVQAAASLAQVLHKERMTLQEALDGEFGKNGAAAIAPLSPYAGASLDSPGLNRRGSRDALHRYGDGLHIRFPGQYPTSPMIELDPATPPAEDAASPLARRTEAIQLEGEELSTNFAPRSPLSAEEYRVQAVLSESSIDSQTALSATAAKLYLQRQQLNAYFRALADEPNGDHTRRLEEIISKHEVMHSGLETLQSQWNESRVALRQLQIAQDRKNGQAAALSESAREALHASTSSSQTPELVDDRATSAALGKRDSTVSTLSTSSGTDGDALATPATSPRAEPDYSQDRRKGRHIDITQLLLDQTNPHHLPPPGLEEQLYEAFSGVERDSVAPLARLSREERIALATQKRAQMADRSNASAEPIPQTELVNELKDVMALLKSRRQVVTQGEPSADHGIPQFEG